MDRYTEDGNFIIEKQKDFILSQTLECGQCFHFVKLDEEDYLISAKSRILHIAQKENRTIFYNTDEQTFDKVWKHYFDLERDYGIYIEAIDPEDTYLKTAAELGSGIRILNQDLWEMIVSFLISQQNNIFRIRKCIDRISRRYGEEKRAADGTVYHAFPTAEALSQATEEELRDCNLGYRAKYVRDTALRVASGEVDLAVIRKMTYPEAREELLKLYGVGVKVADCICLMALHELSAFPVDTHIRQALEKHYPGGLLQQYIFYYELIHKE